MLTSDEVMKVLKDNHDHLMAGHLGIKRTFEKICRSYYWPGYYDTVRRYVSSCRLCQSFGLRNPPVPLSFDLKTQAYEPFSHVILDYIHLPLTSKGNSGALVIVDKFSGWVEGNPTPSQSSAFTCISLVEWICQYGSMLQIHVDNGMHFSAEEVKVMMMSNYGIPIRYGVPYHPQGQGKVERANGVLKNIMKKLA